jgi:hypothetical protein
MKTIVVLVLAVVLTSCARSDKSKLAQVGQSLADPQKVPTEQRLQDSAPLIAVKLEASDSGYTIQAFRSVGTPTSTIHQDRDVVVKTFDQQGGLLTSVAINNPRDAHTTGSKQPATAVLPKATATVFFPKPDAVRSIEVTVIKGANAGLRQKLDVDPAKLRRLEEIPPKKEASPNIR